MLLMRLSFQLYSSAVCFRFMRLGCILSLLVKLLMLRPMPIFFTKDGHLDIMKIKPLVYDTSQKGYHSVGALLGKALLIGASLNNVDK